MTKVLNLDTLPAAIEKTIRLNGVDHAFKAMSVEEFISEMKASEAKDAAGPVPVSESVDAMVLNIIKSFPTMPEADLRAKPLDTLKTILDFINDAKGEDVEEAADAAKN